MIFCNINFKLLNANDLFNRVNHLPKVIIPVNAQLIVLGNTDKRFLNFLNDNYCCFDGQIPLNYAKKQKNIGNIDKLSGSDIVYDFCQWAKKNNQKVFFLGGKKLSNIKAVEKIKNDYSIEIEGYSPPYETYPFSEMFTVDCYNKISSFKPDVLFVGFGAPKQEFYVEENLKKFQAIGIKYIVCCGGTFEFVSGEIARAPKWISKIGLESIYRLFREFNIMRIKRILISFKFKKYLTKGPDFIL